VTVQQSDAADVIRRVLRPHVTPDPGESVLGLDLVEYQCPNCRERCINSCEHRPDRRGNKTLGAVLRGLSERRQLSEPAGGTPRIVLKGPL